MWSIIKDYKKYFSIGILVFAGCQTPNTLVQYRGNALGTTYSVQFEDNAAIASIFEQNLDSIVDVMNASMSTYWPTSTLSKINAGAAAIAVDTHFINVFEKATTVWKATDSLFDPTVGSLVTAYGFGAQEGIKALHAKQRDSIMAFTGWHLVELSPAPNRTVLKSDARVAMDFNALAKGYTIDVIGLWLEAQGIENYLVEIGGEVRARGNHPEGNRDWRVGIDNPDTTTEKRYMETLGLKNQSLATSGNYRKFRIDSLTGEKYVHTINPKTGLATATSVLSASVLAPDCMTADAWATALMLLPPETGLQKIEAQPNLEAFWIIAEGTTTKVQFSKNWPQE
jgi:thiamine biosynthesis lipoprotein